MNDRSELDDLTPAERDIVGAPGDLVSEERVPARQRSSTVLFSLRIDRGTFDELNRIAELHSRTFSETARDALRRYVAGPGEGPAYELLEAIAAKVGVERHRVAEVAADRGATRTGSDRPVLAWGDDDLRRALEDYEATCRRAGMRDKAWLSYVDYARRFLAWREGEYQPRGTATTTRPVPRDAVSTSQLREQAKQYAAEVEAAGRERSTVDTYFRHAMFFVRWLDGEFDPGARLRGLR